MALLFTLPVKEQAIKMITPAKININPKFFNKPFMCVYFIDYFILSHKLKHNSLTGEIIYAKKLLFSVNSQFLHIYKHLIFGIKEYFSQNFLADA